MRGLGLGFTNPVQTRGVLEVCLCFGCGGVGGGVGGVGGECVGCLDQGVEGKVVLYLCESGFFV